MLGQGSQVHRGVPWSATFDPYRILVWYGWTVLDSVQLYISSKQLRARVLKYTVAKVAPSRSKG